ncbi:MAG: hypothetical protein M0Q88_00495 [Bacilli bacterium]|nr:hypothetical protein [Bacilli bacterium]
MEIKIQEKEKGKPKKVVGTQVSHMMYDQLKMEADDAFMSISDLLRKIIFLYYKNEKEKENK